MPFYPQLTTGSVAQYPIKRSGARRTVVNVMQNGANVRMADDGAATVSWVLTYSHLTSAEFNSLQQFFDQTSGRWQNFLFLDPTDNIVQFSEDLSQPVWSADPLLSVAPGQQDPNGGQSASGLTNAAQTTQQVIQKLGIPATYQYCFSVYLQSPQSTAATLVATAGGLEQTVSVTAGSNWTRAILPFQFTSSSDDVSVGVRLDAGTNVSIFGMQLEPQLSAGAYKRTRNQSGVYPNCRFDQDVLQWTATSQNQFACRVQLISNVAG